MASLSQLWDFWVHECYMSRRKDDVFMENEFKRTVAVFDLPCGPLMRSFRLDANGDTEGKTHEWAEEDKRYFNKRKKENEGLLKFTEDMTDEDIMSYFAEDCRHTLHTSVRLQTQLYVISGSLAMRHTGSG